jgi:predicted O-methyltransferase YrrM
MRVLTHLVLWRLGLATAETQTTEAERACLLRLAVGKRRLAEVGVWHGVTTTLLRGAMAPDGVLLAIDPFPRGRLGFSAQRYIAEREVARIANGTVRWLRLTGAEAGRQLAANGEPAVEVVFIDADHTYEGLRGDWEAWSPLVAPGGVVALHDSRTTPERPIDDTGSVRFTQEVVAHDQRFEQVEVVDSLTVWRRKERP